MSNQVDLGTVFKGSSSGKVVKAKGTTLELKPSDVAIDIAWSGLCGTELHLTKNDMVLGHEGVGIVSKVGKDVTQFKVGDRVGWGCNHDSCGHCEECWKGIDTLCEERKIYTLSDFHFGSFGDRAVLNADFVHKIPDSLPLKYAAPLQCGGATVFGGIKRANIQSVDRVGVVGLGGLGHLAIQFLHKMGCEVVVFSGSNRKKDEAFKLGADEFVAVKENPNLEGVKRVKHLLTTTSEQPDWNQLFKVLGPRSQIVPLGVSMSDMTYPYNDLLLKELSIVGSIVAPRQVHQEMLNFAARWNVLPWIEEMPMTEENINKGLERLEKGDIHYRFVFKSQTTDAE
ncbi:alcohol dehydrogenase (NADP(+)) [Malassezia psittaci]|uniref:Alcohol dehydrogenase (NADP(+)) n=1 Tax=Malassezia psittaci TaxID=1821823 RepID=A0AAF0F9P4_9BASI|nr:alcohol dehydrogenase (NADP(+)) [Malassezia psittaci]